MSKIDWAAEAKASRERADASATRTGNKIRNLWRCVHALRDFVLAYENREEPEQMLAAYHNAAGLIAENEILFTPSVSVDATQSRTSPAGTNSAGTNAAEGVTE